MIPIDARRALLPMLTLCLACLTIDVEAAEQPPKALEVDEKTPKLEVRYSQIGFRDTLLFYTFNDEKAVLKLQFGNRDKSFPIAGTVYIFADDVTEEGLKKWLNNQHSDGLYPDVPQPTSILKIPAKFCQVSSHKLTGNSKQAFGEYDNYDVTFEVKDYSDMMSVKLKGFTGETKVHLKTN